MSTQALPLSLPTSAVRKDEKTRPFLEALKQIDCGQLTLTTPEGKKLVFTGPLQGPVAQWSIYDWGVFEDFIARGDLGLADAYMDGRWDSPDVEALVLFGFMNAKKLEAFFHGRPIYAVWVKFKNFFSRNSLTGSRRNVQAHYDLGNDFYKLWLDKSMTYSCALFEGKKQRTLEEAQQAKYARILNKLNAKPGEHVLEIGCGWGGFAEAAAKQGLRVTGVTLAKTQAEYARERMKNAGLDSLVSIELTDYRKVEGQFDHIVSIGMFEHVGEDYWPVYFETIKQKLKPGGTAMIQSITVDDALFESLHNVTGFIERYIFPGGMLPSKTEFKKHAKAAGLDCRELYGFGQDYATTLSHWLGRFEAHQDEVRALGYDGKFIRLWRFYLASCIACFKSRRIDVMQVEITHKHSAEVIDKLWQPAAVGLAA